jgi:hypothetical protein
MLKFTRLAACLALVAAGAARAATPYPAMAPLDRYLMDRDAEIAMARSAAPPSISAGAEVLVLTPRGYVSTGPGRNGFVCLVERAWFSGLMDDGFWNPKLRGPDCYNRQAARSVLPVFLTRTEWVLAGVSQHDILERTHAAVAAGRIRPAEVGSLNYMLSKEGYLGDQAGGPWRPHIMFYMPPQSTANFGANLPGTQVLGSDAGVDPYTMIFIPVARWSDGSPDDAAGAKPAM